jgi:hypothetical protein
MAVPGEKELELVEQGHGKGESVFVRPNAGAE